VNRAEIVEGEPVPDERNGERDIEEESKSRCNVKGRSGERGRSKPGAVGRAYDANSAALAMQDASLDSGAHGESDGGSR
jgi:hypothetical protein